MKIVEKIFLSDFDDFSKLLCGGNYVVDVEMILFEYKGKDNEFDMNTLKFIYPQEASNIHGNVVEINWDSVAKEINEILQYSEYREVLINAKELGKDVVPNDVFEKRKTIFWGIIEKYISLPPDKIYKHIPRVPSFFADFMMWGFCYIFLKDGKGLVLHAGASD